MMRKTKERSVMMKKIVSVMLVFVMLSVVTPWIAVAEPAESGIITAFGSHLPWSLHNGTLTLGGGTINWTGGLGLSPWDNHWRVIDTIIFTEQVMAGTSLQHLFRLLTNVTSIEGLNYLNTSNVTNMDGMFADVSSLISLDLSDWNTSNVTSMGGMFLGTSSLTSLDLSNFDTSNVLNMSSMFYNASSLKYLNLSDWDTKNVSEMSGMFAGTTNLISLDLSNWDTGNVVNMGGMFYNTSSLISLNLSSFDTRNAINMWGIFLGTQNLLQLKLGENFRFAVDSQLPSAPNNAYFTGYWQNVGEGTVDFPKGEFIFTSEELMLYFDGSTMADIWVRQPRINIVPAHFIAAWYDNYEEILTNFSTFNIDVSVSAPTGAISYTPPDGNFDGAKIMIWERGTMRPLI